MFTRMPPASKVGQMNPVHTVLPHFFKTHCNMILHHVGLLNGFFPSGFPHKLLHAFPFPAIHATCSAHLTCLDFITLLSGEEYKL